MGQRKYKLTHKYFQSRSDRYRRTSHLNHLRNGRFRISVGNVFHVCALCSRKDRLPVSVRIKGVSTSQRMYTQAESRSESLVNLQIKWKLFYSKLMFNNNIKHTIHYVSEYEMHLRISKCMNNHCIIKIK